MSLTQDSSGWQLSVKDVATRVDPVWTFDTLDVPRSALSVLREISARVSDREKERQLSEAVEGRSSGTIALLAGQSATEKIAAAEALANDLELPLYRIDVKDLVSSKYIGETEKNLAILFSPVQTGWPILLFDEGDSLFGKRTAVAGSHDRYAEVGAIVARRMQDYPGLILIAVESSDCLEEALKKRLAYSVQFSDL